MNRVPMGQHVHVPLPLAVLLLCAALDKQTAEYQNCVEMRL